MSLAKQFGDEIIAECRESARVIHRSEAFEREFARLSKFLFEVEAAINALEFVRAERSKESNQ
jgi:hypothetical protein